MKRLKQIILIVSFTGFSWLAMQIFHELGHVTGAWLGGGTVTRVIINPFSFSRTDVCPNPKPLLELWCGPLAGVLLPFLIFLFIQCLKPPCIFLSRFFAGFCFVANGVYIGGGAFQHFGDAGDLLRHGSPLWTLILFGVLTVPTGLYLWNGQGRFFGFDTSGGEVERAALVVSLVLFILTIICELLLGLR